MFTQTDLLSDIMSEYPQVSEVLEGFDIGLAQVTSADLAGVAQAGEISTADLVATLNEEVFGRQVPDQFTRDWSQADAAELIEYIVRRHHAYMRRHLPYISGLLDRAAKTGQLAHTTGFLMLHAVFAALKSDMLQHMYIEENVTFPPIIQMEKHRKNLTPNKPHMAETLGEMDPFEQMKQEHAAFDESVTEIRRLMGDLASQVGTENGFEELMTAFGDMESDLTQHIQLENDYLWPVRPS